jgi:hypothetical protein
MQPIANFIGNLTYRVNTLYINEQLYLRMNDSKNNDPQLYYFDATNNEWVYTQTDVYNSLRYGISFEVGDLGYVGLGESNQLYEFDPNR